MPAPPPVPVAPPDPSLRQQLLPITLAFAGAAIVSISTDVSRVIGQVSTPDATINVSTS